MVNIIKTESWLTSSIQNEVKVLNDALDDFIHDEQIINIQLVEENGLSRFWIYVIDK